VVHACAFFCNAAGARRRFATAHPARSPSPLAVANKPAPIQITGKGPAKYSLNAYKSLFNKEGATYNWLWHVSRNV
jgi:hypothetical protein